MQTVKGRTAVISGGSNGAKFEMVKQLLKDGVNVALFGHFAKTTNAAVEEAKKISENIIGFECDVNNPQAAEACLKQVAERFGGIDILMSMHGAHAQPGKSDIEAMDLSFWEGYINGHITGSYVLIRSALPYLKKSKAPRILLETAPVAFNPDEDVLPYSTAKGGVVALSKGCARQLAKYGITVNCLNIGHTPEPDTSPEELEAMCRKVPLGRCCTGADIAFAVETLICEEAGFVTGEVFNLTGGAYVG
ncbi:MAG: SDR family NAD(P)-dependent oxidoreductase [Oscillospiraceae bacterium]